MVLNSSAVPPSLSQATCPKRHVQPAAHRADHLHTLQRAMQVHTPALTPWPRDHSDGIRCARGKRALADRPAADCPRILVVGQAMPHMRLCKRPHGLLFLQGDRASAPSAWEHAALRALLAEADESPQGRIACSSRLHQTALRRQRGGREGEERLSLRVWFRGPGCSMCHVDSRERRRKKPRALFVDCC